MSGLREYRDDIYPPNDSDFNAENMKLFLEFITERQNIWKRRFRLGLPREKWTKDPILKKTKYTNIYRQLDRGSLWCYHMIIRPSWKFTQKTDADFRNLLWKLIIYRLCVNELTFEKVGLPDYGNFEPHTYLKRIYEAIISKDIRFATNAFLVLGGLFKGISRPTGLVYAMMWLDKNIDELISKINDASDGYKVIDALCDVPGASGFIAYEIYCDLCYCKDAIKFNTNDAVNIGPGAIFGIRFLFPSTDEKKSLAVPKILEFHREQDKYLDMFKIKFPYMNWLEPVKDRLSLRTIEHSLCEMGKYMLQHLSAKNDTRYGKNRLEYDKWNSAVEANCHILCDTSKNSGKSLVFDGKAYSDFFLTSGKKMTITKEYKKFKNMNEPSKDDYYNFLKAIQDDCIRRYIKR